MDGMIHNRNDSLLRLSFGTVVFKWVGVMVKERIYRYLLEADRGVEASRILRSVSQVVICPLCMLYRWMFLRSPLLFPAMPGLLLKQPKVWKTDLV